jgi:uncharacterized membrane protein (UPF0136 family)
MNDEYILWGFNVLLVAGGLMGFLKAKSKISLFTSLAFAAVLSLCAMHIITWEYMDEVVLLVLLFFFGSRFAKTRKFMPGGLMAIASIVALALLNLN